MDYREFERAIARIIAPLAHRLLALAVRVTLVAGEDRLPVAGAQVNVGSTADPVLHDRVEYLQQFGFSSQPLPQARGLALNLRGDPGQMVVILLDDRQRQPRLLAAGESMQFNAAGDFLHLRADGTAHLKARKLVLDVDELVMLASQRIRRDVAGYADELRVAGAGWELETWQDGAVVEAMPPQPPAPPASEAPPG